MFHDNIQDKFEDTKWVIRNRKSHDRQLQYNDKIILLNDIPWEVKYYAENYRLSGNTNTTKIGE